MSLFPLDPRYTKVIIASAEYNCLEESLIVIALLSGENIFLDPIAKRQQAMTVRSRYIFIFILNCNRIIERRKLKTNVYEIYGKFMPTILYI
jgi:HrpA-like RNA helicase